MGKVIFKTCKIGVAQRKKCFCRSNQDKVLPNGKSEKQVLRTPTLGKKKVLKKGQYRYN
jgi:hypothetical protein